MRRSWPLDREGSLEKVPISRPLARTETARVSRLAAGWADGSDRVLWMLFRRVVPPTEAICPQGGGRRRATIARP